MPGIGSAVDVAAAGSDALGRLGQLRVVDRRTSPTRALDQDQAAHPIRGFAGSHVAIGGPPRRRDRRQAAATRRCGCSTPPTRTIRASSASCRARSRPTGFLDVALNGNGTRAAIATGGSADLGGRPDRPVRRRPMAGSFDTAGTAFGVALNSIRLARLRRRRRRRAEGDLSLATRPLRPRSAASTMSGIQRDIAVQGNVAYLADQMGRLVTVDVASANAPGPARRADDRPLHLQRGRRGHARRSRTAPTRSPTST